MIVGFSSHGTGCGAGPVMYMTDPNRKGRENHKPEVLRGNPEETEALIDSLDFKYKYTSGVLSFAPGEKITPEMDEKIMDRFEALAFAGLDRDQYDILWVRHSHAGHHELHFVTPRIELETGKSLNIRPPGKATRQAFDDFRSEINARYGLADPDDPARVRNIKSPDHELKQAREALRKGQEPQADIRALVDTILTQRASAGLIRSRGDLLEHVQDIGFKVERAGKGYITIQDPDTATKWRMKGGLYARDYQPSRTIEAASANRERDYSKPDEEQSRKFADRVEQHIAKRAEYHQSRYPKKSRKAGLEIDDMAVVLARDGRPLSLSRFMVRLSHAGQNHSQSSRQVVSYGTKLGRAEEIRSSKPNTELRNSRTTKIVRRDQEPEAHNSRWENLRNTERGQVDNEQPRKSILQRIKGLGSSIHGKLRTIQDRANQLRSYVQSYLSRELSNEAGYQRASCGNRDLQKLNQQISAGLERQYSTNRNLVRANGSLAQIIDLKKTEKAKQQTLDTGIRPNRGHGMRL